MVCKLCNKIYLSALLSQDQYSFVHDALVDYIRCGETVFAPHELRLAITELEAVDSDAKDSGFQRQFKVGS